MGRCSPDYARWSREDTPEALTGWERRQASETSPAHFSSFTLGRLCSRYLAGR
jgi:hypothetical protein